MRLRESTRGWLSLGLVKHGAIQREEALRARVLEFVNRPLIQELLREEEALYQKAGLVCEKAAPNYHMWEPKNPDPATLVTPMVYQLWFKELEKTPIPAGDFTEKWRQLTKWFNDLGLTAAQLKVAYPHLPYHNAWTKTVKRRPQKGKTPPIPPEIAYLINLDKVLGASK